MDVHDSCTVLNCIFVPFALSKLTRLFCTGTCEDFEHNLAVLRGLLSKLAAAVISRGKKCFPTFTECCSTRHSTLRLC